MKYLPMSVSRILHACTDSVICSPHYTLSQDEQEPRMLGVLEIDNVHVDSKSVSILPWPFHRHNAKVHACESWQASACT